MKLTRFINKSYFTVAKFFITKLAYIDSRTYMSAYNALLQRVGVKMGGGKPRFISASVSFDTFNLIEIGERSVISSNTTLLTHDYSYTTSLIASNGIEPKTDIGIVRPILIGRNCFIGMNVTVLPGTIVEDNVIVGAGSVIRGKLAGNSVYIGNPAIKICSIREYKEKIENKELERVIDKK